MAKHPIDYRNKSTPLTMDIARMGDFGVQEVHAKEQIKALEKSLAKTARQIKSLIERAAREPSNAGKINIQIRNREGIYTMKLFKLTLAKKKIQIQEKREETKKENLKKEMQAHIKNLEKIRPVFNPKSEILPTKEGNIEQVRDSRPLVKRVGNKVMPRRYKEFSNK